ncbi:IMPACT family protein [Fulvivirga lutea]|uniref:YigZ family protein n=1 Tax=Fulvivirga lutea TaxID=2810512 RepID=A0A974WIC4_9BACT|nr:YigZ family protein [Fulvivirga lutea]QSE97697.1 YigZ family protein [Fulvivirga lutea]
MITSYLTITNQGEGLFKDKGSKFIGRSFHVESEEEVKAALEGLRKEFYDARHHCYGYVLGADKAQFRANDDGEPNHSAGDPILGQIHSKDLTDTLVVVVRYFGGTKLGVSGLINAYKLAAEEALNNSKIEEVVVKESFTLVYPYDSTNEVMRLVSDLEIQIVDQKFESDCTLFGKVKIDKVEELKGKVELLNNTGTVVGLNL